MYSKSLSRLFLDRIKTWTDAGYKNLEKTFIKAVSYLEPEQAHRQTINLLKTIPILPHTPSDPMLEIKLWGLSFPNPLGIAAGFDKNAEVFQKLIDFGLGFAEVGTITPLPQNGNPQPRLFRLTQDQAILNRMGFNGLGSVAIRKNIQKIKKNGILGINIGKNKTSEDAEHDYIFLATMFADQADYLVINVSSPNTPGLRDLQNAQVLTGLLKAIKNVTPHTPLILKISPDLSPEQEEDIAEILTTFPLHGCIISNTTTDKLYLHSSLYTEHTGGISGKPIFRKSTELLARMFSLTQGKIPFIGCGGISSASDAYTKIQHGASLIQLYSSIVFQGLSLTSDIIKQLPILLQKDGFTNISQAVGCAISSTNDKKNTSTMIINKSTN